ncbi:hypothetical protein ACNO7P_03125 [Bisgaard Taxon 45]
MKMSKRIFLKNLSLLSVGQAFIPFTQADTAFQPARRGWRNNLHGKHYYRDCKSNGTAGL